MQHGWRRKHRLWLGEVVGSMRGFGVGVGYRESPALRTVGWGSTLRQHLVQSGGSVGPAPSQGQQQLPHLQAASQRQLPHAPAHALPRPRSHFSALNPSLSEIAEEVSAFLIER